MHFTRSSVLLCAGALVFAAACSDEPSTSSAPRSTPSASESAAPTPSPDASEAPDDTFDPADVSLGTRVAAEGFEAPVGLAAANDGTERLFVVEQGGAIRYIDRDGEVQPFLDIGDRTEASGEQGLLGLAFHPDFSGNGRFFVNYTDLEGDTVIAGYTSPDGRTADAASERVLLRIDQPYANHNGGDLAFGPDGYLYIATGDGGSAGDPLDNGQNPDALLGKLLRIDVDARDAGEYGIPRDNPLVDTAGARPEIWALGLRNPWQFSFDRATDDLWIADVGQGEFEEINREPAGSEGGANYGWRVVEGGVCYLDPDCDLESFESPVATYSHDLGCSVTGGYVYRGTEFPKLNGAYVTGDYCSGNMWALPADVDGVDDPAPSLETEFGITSFGEDEAGELYLTDVNTGTVLQVTAN